RPRAPSSRRATIMDHCDRGTPAMQGGRAPGKPRLARGDARAPASSRRAAAAQHVVPLTRGTRRAAASPNRSTWYVELLDRATLGEVRLRIMARRPSAPRTHVARGVCGDNVALLDNTRP